MTTQNFEQLIEQRLTELEEKLAEAADKSLFQEVENLRRIAEVDQGFALGKARYILEVVVLDMYRRELPKGKKKPLFDMIEALCGVENLLSKSIIADLNYIRIKGNLQVHVQESPVPKPMLREIETVVLMVINLVEWYLFSYLPRDGEARQVLETELPMPPNPYRGLAAFREQDAAFLFGRDADKTAVIAALQQQPLVMIAGASGSGKSSLAFAGVLATLRPLAEWWLLPTVRPKNAPLSSLAAAFVAGLYDDPVQRSGQVATLATQLEQGTADIGYLLQTALDQQGKQRALLVVDQFEELFTLNKAEAQQAFAACLSKVVQLPSVAESGLQWPLCSVLITVRADFLGYVLGLPGWPELLNAYPKQLLGPVLDETALLQMVTVPAKSQQVWFESLLPERILRDTLQVSSASTDQVATTSLPLLQFGLQQLWARQAGRRLSHAQYEAMGGIAQALATHAEAVFLQLSAADQATARVVLTRLVHPGEGTEDTRQLVERSVFSADQWRVVALLADGDLVVTDAETAEVAHEALLQHWQRLRDWMNADRAFRVWQEGLKRYMADGVLLSGTPLSVAQEFLGSHEAFLSEGERGFILESISKRENEKIQYLKLLKRIPIEIIRIGFKNKKTIENVIHSINKKQIIFGFSLLEVKNIENYENQKDFFYTKELYNLIESQINDIKGYHPIVIGLLEKQLHGEKFLNLFSSKETKSENLTGKFLVSTYGVKEILYPIPTEIYLSHKIMGCAIGLLYREQLIHDEQRYCFFHRKVYKQDIKYSIQKGFISDKIKEKLKLKLEDEQLESFENFLKLCSKIKNQEDWEKMLL